MNIVLTGLPNIPQLKLSRLVFLFKPLLQRIAEKFWIKEIYDIRGTDFKGAKIEFRSPEEAYSALKVLDGFIYRDGQNRYIVKAHIEETVPYTRSPSPYRYGTDHRDERDARALQRDREWYSRSTRRYSRERDRSRSPHYSSEASKLDLEIELLRKKRMIIEEERRLLLEKKKLEMVKEFGPSAVKDIDFMEDRDRRRHRVEQEEPMRQPRRPPRPQDKARTQISPNKDKPLYKDRLPAFYSPCNMILGDMKDVIKKNVPTGKNDLLYKILRTSLRKRITILLGDERKRLNATQIFDMYRVAHPPETDELIVKKILDDIKACQLITSTTNVDGKSTTGANKGIPKAGKKNTGAGNAISTSAWEISTKAEKGTTLAEDASAAKENVTAANETVKQEDKTSAEVNKKVETDDTDTSVSSANIKMEAKLEIKEELKTEQETEVKGEEVKEELKTEPEIDVKPEEITAEETVSEKTVEETDKVEMDKNVESADSAEMAVDKVADAEWPEGDDWNDLETKESEQMLQG